MSRRGDDQSACVDDEAAEAFVDHFDLRPRAADRATLEAIGAAFARLPYENLSKLLRKHAEQRSDDPLARRRMPADVLAEHLTLGAGGTCFALTRLFQAVLSRLGYRSRVALCDTSHQADGHCALLVDAGADAPLLVDPGYLLHQPLPLVGDGGAASAARGGARLEQVAGERYELHTYGRKRYTLKLATVDRARFEAVWDASFYWTMMNGVHLCAADGDGGYAYLNGHKLRLQGLADKRTLNLRGREVDELAARFGLAPELIERAYGLVERARRSAPSSDDASGHATGEGS
jgi:hypothetical protein